MRSPRIVHHPLASKMFYGALCCALALSVHAGCGAKQETSTTQRTQSVERFECVPDRWASPPESIGDAPDGNGPDARDLDPFRSQPTPTKD